MRLPTAFAVGMFAFSDVLAYYATEAKQYAVEAFVASGLIYLGIVWRERSLTWGQAMLAGLDRRPRQS